MRIGKCEKCGAQIMMCRYAKPPHNKAPIEVQPSADGNILVTGTSYEILSPEDRKRAQARGWVLRKNHFATCTHAQLFAKKKPARLANVVPGPWGGRQRR